MYVWVDALTNYINALDWTSGGAAYRKYWADSERRVHVVGKGVIRFHAVYWPAMLMSAGLPIPTEIVVHGYITLGGQKLSKSLGNVVDPADLVRRYGSDAVRHFLLADISPFRDGDFTEERLILRYNVDLANGLGNLVSRVATMLGKYRDSVVPPPGPISEKERSLASEVLSTSTGVSQAMDRYDHREASLRLWDLVRAANTYVGDRAPWHLAKLAESGDTEASLLLDTSLHYLVGCVREVGRLLSPFLPEAANKIEAMFANQPSPIRRADDWLEDLTGQRLTPGPILFPRLEQADRAGSAINLPS